MPRLGVDQAVTYAYSVSRLKHAAFEHQAGAEALARLLRGLDFFRQNFAWRYYLDRVMCRQLREPGRQIFCKPGRESLAASVASRRIEGQHCQKHRLTRGAPRGQAQHEVTRRISGQQGSKNHGKAQNEPPAPAWSIETYLESRRRLLLQVT